MFTSNIDDLEERKEKLRDKLGHLDDQLEEGEIDQKEYSEREFELLDGRFRSDALTEMDDQIEREKKKRNALVSGSFILLIAVAITLFQFNGITGLAVFDNPTQATLPIQKNYTQKTMEELPVNTTEVRVSGNVYGHGEAWVYLVHNGTKRLVYYADTAQDSQITGMVTGTPVNQTSQNKTPPGQAKKNTTTNETNNTTQTNATTNQTTNQTNTTTNETINATNTTNQTNTTADFSPDIIIENGSKEIGDNITINVTPENSTYTLYMHTPTDTYLLQEDWWVVQEKGNHTISGLISKDNQTERVSEAFKAALPKTHTFSQQCVETCSLGEKVPVKLEIVLNGTNLELSNVTYIAEATTVNDTNTTNETTTNQTSENETNQTTTTQLNQRPSQTAQEARQRSCLAPNPNARPPHCFNQTELEKRFPNRNITLINSLGNVMARFNGQGNMFTKGQLIENSTQEPQQYDLVINGKGNKPAAWLNAATGDLHLTGQLHENQDTLMWTSRQDYVVNNRNGMYLGVFEAKTGDLRIRGTLQEGELR